MTALLARDRVRRLYCLECGEGAFTALPCTKFVELHSKRHSLKEDDADKNFLVVERPIEDDTVKLDDNLSSMFTKSWLEWGGSVDVAGKWSDKAKKQKSTGVGI